LNGFAAQNLVTVVAHVGQSVARIRLKVIGNLIEGLTLKLITHSMRPNLPYLRTPSGVTREPETRLGLHIHIPAFDGDVVTSESTHRSWAIRT
jgi:hypothetical protein